MKRLIQDLILPIVVLLALPIGMLGPALTLPLLVYGFPFILLAIFVGLLWLLRQEKGEEQVLVLLNPEDFAIRALARVVATAKRDDAAVVLASVVSAEEAILQRDVKGSLTHQTQLIRLRLDKLLENVSWRLEESGVRTRRRSEIAEPSSHVPDLAREEEADLVVLTPRSGRLRQAHAAMPDWAQAIACPVLALAS